MTPAAMTPAAIGPAAIAPATIAPAAIAPATIAPATITPAAITPAAIAPVTIAPSTIAPSTIAPATIAPSTIAPGDFHFQYPLRVRWAEVDMQGVVFNANYLLYFDVAGTEYFRSVGGGDRALLKSVFDRLYVVKSSVEYHRPAHFDDELQVHVRTGRIGRSSMTLAFAIFRGSERLVSGENVYVYAEGGASQPIPEEFRQRIESLEQGALRGS